MLSRWRAPRGATACAAGQAGGGGRGGVRGPRVLMRRALGVDPAQEPFVGTIVGPGIVSPAGARARRQRPRACTRTPARTAWRGAPPPGHGRTVWAGVRADNVRVMWFYRPHEVKGGREHWMCVARGRGGVLSGPVAVAPGAPS